MLSSLMKHANIRPQDDENESVNFLSTKLIVLNHSVLTNSIQRPCFLVEWISIKRDSLCLWLYRVNSKSTSSFVHFAYWLTSSYATTLAVFQFLEFRYICLLGKGTVEGRYRKSWLFPRKHEENH
jgi:hypothetical protein